MQAPIRVQEMRLYVPEGRRHVQVLRLDMEMTTTPEDDDVGDQPKTVWCGKTKTHGSHFYQDAHTGETRYCPGYTEVR